MSLKQVPLPDLRLPGLESQQLFLDGQPISIYDTTQLPQPIPTPSPAVSLATVLYNWNPESLLALLDLDNWFSLTWLFHSPSTNTKIEIGRIRNILTMGTLDEHGNWNLMLSYTLPSPFSSNSRWEPNPSESMLKEKNISDPEAITSLAASFAKSLLSNRRWETCKGAKHTFFIEHALLDPWEDGIQMDPHWLYSGLDLGRCTTCKKQQGATLNRCGRCGTAAYCSTECQRRDWAVHKGVCAMGLEERGKALHLSKDGGLVGLCQGRGDEGNRGTGDGNAEDVEVEEG